MRAIILFFFMSSSSGLLAQQVVATAGSTLENSTGSISYTIGEGVAQTLTQGDKTLTQGFHQTTISVSIGSEMKDLDFSISVFPNPASDMLTLRLTKEDVSGLQYLLFDSNGKLLSRKNLGNSESEIPFHQLAVGIYLLKVQAGAKELKIFKIIKE